MIQNLPVLITGAAGFVGARLVECCNRNKIDVISVDDEKYFKSRPEHRGLDFGTVVDREKLFDWLEKSSVKCAAIFHLGACTRTHEMNEEYLMRVNTQYSCNLWNHAVRAGVPMIYASSAATYGAGEKGYEDDEKKIYTLKPLNPYGESKQKFDLWVLEQEKKDHLPPSWSGFKFFNVYGFGEHHKDRMASVVFHSFNQINKEGQVRLFRSHKPGFKDGEQKRDFVFVGDVIEILIRAWKQPIQRGIYNLGSGKARTFLDLARATFKAMGKKEKIVFIDTPLDIRDKYQYFTEAPMGKLTQALGSAIPQTSLEEGVSQYVQRLMEYGH